MNNDDEKNGTSDTKKKTAINNFVYSVVYFAVKKCKFKSNGDILRDCLFVGS